MQSFKNEGKYFFPIKLSVDVSAKIIQFFSGHILSYLLLLLNNKAEKNGWFGLLLNHKAEKMDWLWSKKVIKNGRHIWIPPTMPIDQTNQTSKLLKRFMMKAICDCFSFTSHCYPIQKTNSYQRDRTTPILGREYYTTYKMQQ